MERKKKIQVKDLLLIYGKNIEEAQKFLKEEKSQKEIFEQTKSTVAVNNISFDVDEHEMMVIMGLSGSGKSSLLKCLNRLNMPTSGEIVIDGEDILKYDKRQLREYRQNKIGMVFQNFGLLPQRTVLQNVEFGLEVCKKDKKQRTEKALNMIELVGLKGWENSKPKELSGGMQQRVGLARALANEPEILLMDEPFSALDPLIRRQMQDELLRLQSVLKKTIVFITHDIDEAFRLGDRIAIMKDGEFEQIGYPHEIMENPSSNYVAEFIKDINKTRVYRAGNIGKENFENFKFEYCVSDTTPMEEILSILNEHEIVGVVDKDGVASKYIDKDIAIKIFERNSK